jgi:hypothetical protein
MKKENLMIGDYVFFGECKPNMGGDYDVVFYHKKLTLDDFKFFADNDWTNADFDEFLKPIPITDKFLLENGFTRSAPFSSVFEREIDGISSPVQISTSLHQLRISSSIPRVGRDFEITLTRIKYIHELQHALKLCGYDIDLKISELSYLYL